jgi:hypothetical protein
MASRQIVGPGAMEKEKAVKPWNPFRKRQRSLFEEPRSHFTRNMVIGAAMLAAGAVLSVKAGNKVTDRNLDMLCSASGGLEYSGSDGKNVTYRTTLVGETLKDRVLEATIGVPMGYLIDGKTAEEYRPGTVTFQSTGSGIVPVKFEVDSAGFALTRPVDMVPLLQDSECMANIGSKIDNANQIRFAEQVRGRKI